MRCTPNIARGRVSAPRRCPSLSRYSLASFRQCRALLLIAVHSAAGPERRVLADLAVEAEGLVKRFGQTRALDGIGLAVPAGSIHGVLGPNGAGKTTTLRTLLGILDPDAG